MNVPRLHPDTIEEVKQRADIIDVVSDRVMLRRQGKDFAGLCPFHEEKTPSFTVSQRKQMYYCFGCGAGGNAIKFLMDLDKLSFAEAVLDLAKRYQVSVKTLDPEQRQEIQQQLSIREQLYEILALAAAFYQHALRQPQGQHALDYLRQQRQLRDETIQTFQLGYAPGGWETLHRYLVEQKGHPVSLVEKAGLIVPRKSGDSYYDRFRDRLIVPICDLRGRVIGFGGRALGDEQPKYLNSPETELFNKGKTLFALDKARDAIAKEDRAVVVEGYFDAIALHAAGIQSAVACLGTALSQDQIKLLLRYSDAKQAILNFDADKSGVAAAERAIAEIAPLAYSGEVKLRILNLPEGKDADEFLRNHSPQAYLDLLDRAPLWLDWQIEQILTGQDLRQADRFQSASTALVKLLSKITHPDIRTHYIRHCAEQLSLGKAHMVRHLEENLYRQTRQLVRKTTKPDRAASLSDLPDYALLERAEALLLRIYLHCPEERQQVREAIADLAAKGLDFSLSHHRLLWQCAATLPVTAPNLVASLQDKLLETPEQLAQVSHLLHLDERQRIELMRLPLLIRTAIATIEEAMCEKRCRYLSERLQETMDADPAEARRFQKLLYEEKRYQEQLNQQRHARIADLVEF